jgi:hypothetical protein
VPFFFSLCEVVFDYDGVKARADTGGAVGAALLASITFWQPQFDAHSLKEMSYEILNSYQFF